MSHTKDGGLVAEASSTNRARQGSNGQSTKKASPFDLAWALLKESNPIEESASMAPDVPMSTDEKARQIIERIRARNPLPEPEPEPEPEPQPESEPEPYVNPRKVGVRRRAKPARGIPRSARREE